jgi:hypothetical protein
MVLFYDQAFYTVFNPQPLKTTSTMCQVKTFRSCECKHTWMEIIESCGPGMGFDNCSHLTFYGTVQGCRPHATHVCCSTYCPWDGRHGNYSLNTARVVTKMRHGIKIGRDPNPCTPGIELICTVM